MVENDKITFISLIELFNRLITSSFWASLASISGIISFWKSPLVVFCKKVCTEPGHSVTFRPLTEGWSTISFTISFSWPLIALMRRKILQKLGKRWRISIVYEVTIATDDADKQDFFVLLKTTKFPIMSHSQKLRRILSFCGVTMLKNYSILALSTNFCPIKSDLPGNTL